MNRPMRFVPRILSGAAAALLVLSAVPAAAAEAVGTFEDWRAFAEPNGEMCYMGSEPKKAEGNYTKRDDPFLLVTHRPKEKSIGVVSVVAGYTYKKGSEVSVTIGAQTFRMFTDGGNAWAYDAKDDRALIAAMKGGATMVVKGTSGRGTVTTDTYSLSGFTAAYAAIGKACKVP